MAEQRQVARAISRRARGPAPRASLLVNRAQAGFTLVELVVVLGMIAIMAAMALAAWRQGLFREYAQSAQIRALTNALHLAQWRALKGGISIPIAAGTSTDTVTSGGELWYNRVQFQTVFPHDFKVGDWVSFSDIASLPPGSIGHSGLNVGRYSVTAIVDQYNFKISSTGLFDATMNDIPQSPPYPSPAPVPMVRNATGAAKLVLMKKSTIRAMLTVSGEAAALIANPQNFVYDDSHTFIWGYTASGAGSPEVSGVPTDPEYTVTVRFNSRGLPADPAGYQLAVGKDPSEFGAALPKKIITITPTGKINPGGS
ncbi:MAG: prepilin-type N-terminal cleavage/methylation domain-containing protein [Desulfomonile tiedjei]|nr:prepilin-type N-terminal cleavage/methylation domain-containing protein [Desulfomonile tiedjei]